jgi:chromosome partitioning protein
MSDIIPSHIDLVAIEIELLTENRYMLKKALQSVKDDYDYIIIDCAPSLGPTYFECIDSS